MEHKPLYFCVVKWFSLFLSVYFLLGSFLPRADWEELPKMAVLVDHYQEHKAGESQEYGFLDFVWSHYVHPEKSHDDAQHQHLPFVQHQLVTVMAPIPLFSFRMQLHTPVISHMELPVYLNPRQHQSAVFQPPRA